MLQYSSEFRCFISLISINITKIKEHSTQSTSGEGYNNEIFWELNWLNQWDPRLIKFIKERILILPPTLHHQLNLNIDFDEEQPWKHQGQNGEALLVEYLHDLIKSDRSKHNYNFYC